MLVNPQSKHGTETKTRTQKFQGHHLMFEAENALREKLEKLRDRRRGGGFALLAIAGMSEAGWQWVEIEARS